MADTLSCGQERSAELEASVEAEVEALISLLRARRAALIDAVRADRERRLRSLRDGVTESTSRLQKTTALLQFCIEALKETDPVAFLQVTLSSLSQPAIASHKQ